MAARRPTLHSLILVRACPTEWEQDRRLLGAADLPAVESSHAAVVTAARRLVPPRPASVHHPGDEAARTTARLVAEIVGGKARVASDLADPSLGLLEGLRVQELAERHPRRHRQWQQDPLGLAPPDGEAIEPARARILGAVARILRRAKGEPTAVVLHGLGHGLLATWLADRPPSDLWALETPAVPIRRYLLAPADLDALQALADAPTGAPAGA